MREPSFVMPLKKVLIIPLERLASDTPTWGWALAWIGGAWQWLSGDTFSSLLALIVLLAGADYYYGVKAARLQHRFSPSVAQRGWHGKMSGIVLLLGVRLFEGWAASFGLVNSQGGIATALGIALLTVDLQSIAHHREAFGAAPIPLLSAVLAWMKTVGPPGRTPPPPPEPTAEEAFKQWMKKGGPDANA